MRSGTEVHTQQFLLQLTVFLSGALVMVYELVGSRVIGPYFGTSIYIWTSLIGIILGSLSLGYYWGGKLADLRPTARMLSLVIFAAAVLVGTTLLLKDLLLVMIYNAIPDLKISSVVASVILFAPASVFLGMVSPYAVKLSVLNLKGFGQKVGNLYALSTLGSIFGTFLAGFYLIPHFGTSNILVIITVLLFGLSIVWGGRSWIESKLAFVMMLMLALSFGLNRPQSEYLENFIDVDTVYNRVWIYDFFRNGDENKLRIMKINNESSSLMFVDEPTKLVSEYTEYYHLARYFAPNFKKSLMIGGAGYSFPKNYLMEYPLSSMDVVEIDSKLTDLAYQYFGLNKDEGLRIFHEDGRIFLNRGQEKYDVIFGDAFSSQYSVPFSLTTLEAVQKQFNMLTDNGVVIMNIIGAIEGERGKFLRAEYWTYRQLFPQVLLFPVEDNSDGEIVQNIMLVALKSSEQTELSSEDEEIQQMLQHLWGKKIDQDLPILTDEHAPVDYYVSQTI